MMLQVVIEQVPAPPAPPPPGVDPWALLDSGQITTIAVVAIIAAVLVLLPMLVALARRLERGGGSGDVRALRADLDALHAQVAELTDERARVAELEERVDFAERLLAQHREPARMPGGRPE